MRRAFTLLEVLLAIGIFVIGFVAVASMFPVAAVMQKNTVADVTGQQFARTLRAMCTAIATETKIMAPPINAAKDGQVYDVSAALGADDLAYPQDQNRNVIEVASDPNDTMRKKFYARLFVRWNGSKWVYYSFILSAVETGSTVAPFTVAPAIAIYPVSTATAPNGFDTIFTDTSASVSLRVGDWFLDDLGSTWIVKEFDAATHAITVEGLPASGPPAAIRAADAGKCKKIDVSTKSITGS